MQIIRAGEIRQHYSMKQAIDAMERAFIMLSSNECHIPMRVVTRLPAGDLLMLYKPAFVEKDRKVTAKFITQRERTAIPGLPSIQGIVMVIDSVTGEIIAVMDGNYITALRTGAASGLATRLFAGKDARTMALFGCGAQGKTQVKAVLCERPISKILIFEKTSELAYRFIDELHGESSAEMVFCEDITALKEADVICTATNATAPLFKREDVKKGAHINAVGSFQPHMQELDPWLIQDARVFLDSWEPCLKESGDLIKPIREGIFIEGHIAGEIGDVLLKRIEGRESDDQITLFKSVGVAIQDYVVATDIYNCSLEKGFGIEINLSD